MLFGYCVEFRASPACGGGFQTRPHVASPSHSEGEGVCLVGLPGCGQIHMLVGSGVAPSLGRLGRLIPLHPTPIGSPARCGLPAEEGTRGGADIAALSCAFPASYPHQSLPVSPDHGPG